MANEAATNSIADPSYQITFPRDHGPHKNFRIEWWYLQINQDSEI